MRTSLPAAEQQCMLSRVQAGARLLGRVSPSNVSRKCQQILCDLRSPSQQQWLAAPQRSSSTAAPRLAGKNIFQVRAAAEAVETSPADAQEQQQQPEKQLQQPKQQKGKQQQKHQPHAQQEAPKMVPLPTSDESEQLLRIRHSCAHIMAMAVQRLHKDAQVTIGPWIDRGFYYDFDLPTPLSDKELKAIRKEMQKIMRMDLPFIREDLSPEEAEARIQSINEPYKLEILQSIRARDPAASITIYHIGETDHPAHWWDLCAGPHVERTGSINPNAFDLESVAGAYWRGDEKNAMLQRIYGTAWENPEQLTAYNHLKVEAARRDHRKLGQELDLFSIQEEAGGGLVFWHPRGARVRHVIETFWKDLHLARGYELVYSPHIAKVDLWKTSGHFDFYAENMYDQMKVEEEEYQLKPMNCPFHVAMYKDGYHSYRDLPIRMAELGTVYRYERSGTMHGLFRVRGFTQDDAHIFCLPDQIAPEIRGVLDLVEEVLSAFGFSEYEINLSTRPEKYVGDDAIWDTAEAALKEALAAKGWSYGVDEGGGAFYGPKIDVKIQDAIGRKWQCSTIQLDFNLPQRFDMAYIDSDGSKKQPIMIHRAIFGSLERFFGILVENYAGAFPLWLAPVQVRLMPVNDAVVPYVMEAAIKTSQMASTAADSAEQVHQYFTRQKAGRPEKGTCTHQQQGGSGCVSSRRVGRPRRQHSLQAVQAWLSGVNHMQHGSMPYSSKHQNTYEESCAAGGKISKHRRYVSVRVANTSSEARSCHVCSGKGSKPERVLYAVADAEELVKQYAVEACSLSNQGVVKVCDSTIIHPSRKRWDLSTVTPHGLLVEVMGEGHSSRLVTKANNTDDSISERKRKDHAYAQAAVDQGWSVLWLWVQRRDPTFKRTAKKWAAQLREALKYVIAEGKPMLFDS